MGFISGAVCFFLIDKVRGAVPDSAEAVGQVQALRWLLVSE